MQNEGGMRVHLRRDWTGGIIPPASFEVISEAVLGCIVVGVLSSERNHPALAWGLSVDPLLTFNLASIDRHIRERRMKNESEAQTRLVLY